MAVDSNGNLYAAGSFRQVGSLIVNCIEKWDGGRWSSLGTGISSGTPTNIYALAIDNSGNLYAAGDFTKAGGGSALNIAQWDGMNWSPLGAGISSETNAYVAALEIGVDQNLYVGGTFTTAGSINANHIACWDGSNWVALGDGITSSVTYDIVKALAVDKGGNLYVGGDFRKAGDQPSASVALWMANIYEAFLPVNLR